MRAARSQGEARRFEGHEVGFGGIARRIERHYRRYRQRGEANSRHGGVAGQGDGGAHLSRTARAPALRATRLLFTIARQDDLRCGRSCTSTNCTLSWAASSRPAAAPTPGARCWREIRGRVELLLGIGLDYLSLNRRSGTLSGGESQRIRLSTQIGSGLMGMLYVLDEPSIGLHPKDNVKMIATLESLRDIGNTVIVVEHDEDTIRAADHIVEMGPGPGVHGGEWWCKERSTILWRARRRRPASFSPASGDSRRPCGGARATAGRSRCAVRVRTT